MSVVRRFLRWYLGDSGRAVAVWTVWAAMTATAAGYVWYFAPDMPVNDEWVFVPRLFADTDTQLKWVVEAHAEHRYPLARSLYLLLFHAAGMWVTVGLLAASAAVFVRAARRVRGRTEFADCWFPLLMLHGGHYENLLMGYQIVFTLTVFGVALFAALATRTGWSSARVGWAGAGVMAVVALGGGLGMVFAPFVGGWLAWRLTFGRTDRLDLGGWVGLVTVVAAGGYTLWAFTDALANPFPKPPRSLDMIWTGVQTLGVTFGPSLTARHWSPTGLGLLAVGAVAVPYLGWRAWKEPAARGHLLGQLSVVCGVAGFVAAVAVGRENVPASRYACFAALAPCAVGLGLAGRLPAGRWWRVGFTLLAVAGGGVLLWVSGVSALSHGRSYRTVAERVRADAAAGVPIDLIAERHRLFAVEPFADYWFILWRNGVGPAKGAAPPDPTLASVPAGVPVPDPGSDRFLDRYRLLADGDYAAVALRVRFISPDNRALQPLRFRWVEVATDGTTTPKVSDLSPWVVVGPGVANVWVNGRVKAAWLEVGKTEPLTLTAVELVVRAK